MFSRVYFLYKIECMEITHYESHPLLYHNAHTVKKWKTRMELTLTEMQPSYQIFVNVK